MADMSNLEFQRRILILVLIASFLFSRSFCLDFYGTDTEERETIRAKVKLTSGVCKLNDLKSELYNCSLDSGYNRVGILEFECSTLERESDKLKLLYDCNALSENKKEILAKECKRLRCPNMHKKIYILVFRLSDDIEEKNNFQLYRNNYRLINSSRKIKISPIPIVLLTRKDIIESFYSDKTVDYDWNSPFLGKYMVYMTTLDTDVSSLAWLLNKMESLFSELKESLIDVNSNSDVNLSLIFQSYMSLISLSLSLLNLMEIYWTRGSAVNQNLSGRTEISKYASHCNLDLVSILLDCRFALDIINNKERDLNIIFAYFQDRLRFDINKFQIISSTSEINSGNTGNISDLKSFLNDPFLCTRYKINFKENGLQKYFYEQRYQINKFLNLKHILKEDIVFLISIISYILENVAPRFSEDILGKFSSLRVYMNRVNNLTKRLNVIKSEVYSVCSRKAFERWSKGEDLTDLYGKVCNLHYSLNVTEGVMKLLYSEFEKSRLLALVPPILTYSDNKSVSAALCLHRALYKSNLKNIRGEIIVKAVVLSSNRFALKTGYEQLHEECRGFWEFNFNDLVPLESLGLVCNIYATCMENKKLSDIVERILTDFRNIDMEGALHKKSIMASKLCTRYRKLVTFDELEYRDEEESVDINTIECNTYRILQLAYRGVSFLTIPSEYQVNLRVYNKSGFIVNLPDNFVANQIVINDFCVDPEIFTILDCNVVGNQDLDISETKYLDKGNGVLESRRYNTFLLADNIVIRTSLDFFKGNMDEYEYLSNGVVFARIRNKHIGNPVKIVNFSHLPEIFIYENNNIEDNDDRDNTKLIEYDDTTNIQKLVVLKAIYSSSSLAYVTLQLGEFSTSSYFKTVGTSKEKFLLPDSNNLQVPLVPTILQIFKQNSEYYFDSFLYPTIQIQEFVNPLVTTAIVSRDIYNQQEIPGQLLDPFSIYRDLCITKEESMGVYTIENMTINNSKDSLKNSEVPSSIDYPIGFDTLLSLIENIDLESSRKIAEGIGWEYLALYFKAKASISYLLITQAITLWTGGSKFRQHCDFHLGNILIKFSADWKNKEWLEVIKSVCEYLNLSHSVIIDLDLSYESDNEINNLERDIELFDTISPCKLVQFEATLSIVLTEDDHINLSKDIIENSFGMSYIIEQINNIKPDINVIHELNNIYPDIMNIYDDYYKKLSDIQDNINNLIGSGNFIFSKAFRIFVEIRYILRNFLLKLNNLVNNVPNYNLFDYLILDMYRSRVEKKYINFSKNGNKDDFSRDISLDINVKNSSHKNPSNLKWLHILPESLPNLQIFSKVIYCIIDTLAVISFHPKLKFSDLINFLLQHSVNIIYLRKVDYGSNIKSLEIIKSKLNSEKKTFLQCIDNSYITNIIEDNAILITKSAFQLSVQYQPILSNSLLPSQLELINNSDMYQSVLLAYMYHFDFFISDSMASINSIGNSNSFVKLKADTIIKNNLGTSLVSLNLSINQWRSLLELHYFCNKYSRIVNSNNYNIKCKLIPNYQKLKLNTPGLIILSWITENSQNYHKIVFPWVYSSSFSEVIDHSINLNPINGITVLAEISGVSNTFRKNSLKSNIFIHKNYVSIFSFGSQRIKYKVPSSISERYSIQTIPLSFDSYLGFKNLPLDSLVAYVLLENEVTLYKWLQNILSDYESTLDKHTKNLIKNKVAQIFGAVVRTFISIWKSSSKCRHDKSELCLPLFCGISSHNIILFINSSQNIDSVKFAFMYDMEMQIISKSEDQKPQYYEQDTNNSEYLRQYTEFVSYILPEYCGHVKWNLNDLLAVLHSTDNLIKFLKDEIVTLNPNVLFSSKIKNINKKYVKISLYESLKYLNDKCREIQQLVKSPNIIC
ncbi:hypothetical protein cand_034870 [Cryptosporidium andersoni]|uniref:Uncharacterized protein n=1 Tax=Cryptosporidium andersoni TaxID=117008 RepID=A0A1J4MVU3_9CRYT|nr:hypothetical protein cand_034870 [Cryptosporidium andersoni]